MSAFSGTAAQSPPAGAEESSPGPVDPNSTTTSSVWDAAFSDTLPIIGHFYQDTLLLAPGVSDFDGDMNPVVHGSRDTSVRFGLDGADSSDPAAGGWALNLNPLSIDTVRLITAGAPAEFGRAMGGFADVTTRSGSNDFSGRLWILWRGSFLDGDGADNEDGIPFEENEPEWNDLKTAIAAGGAFVPDTLWYFASLESLDTEFPTQSLGPDTLIETHGYFGLGKLTWQADPLNRIDVTIGADPLAYSGLGVTSFSSPDSGFDREQGGVATQLLWTGIFSDDVMLEAGFLHFDTDLSIEPTSDEFGPKEIAISRSIIDSNQFFASYPCVTFNCSMDDDISRIDRFGQVSGPYPFRIDQDKTRDTLRAALTIDRGDLLGDHRFRMGFEAGREELHEERAANLVLFDLTTPFITPFPGPVNPFAVSGIQILQAPQPSRLDGTVNNFTTSAWLSDSWKILPGLSINAGVRYDAEDMDAPGYAAFDPREERRDSIGLWKSVCAEARRQFFVPASSNCFSAQTYDGQPPDLPSGVIDTFQDADMNGVNDVPMEVAQLDVNRNGTLEFNGVEGKEIYKHLTTSATRDARRFAIQESNVSPRIGIAWDPWQDGKTRAFAHWGRYYDRLRLETALLESGPSSISFTFAPNPTTHLITPGASSVGSALPSISQVDHELQAPYTDEWSLGFERELGTVWSAGLTFVNRRGEDLLYERDVNHYTCAQAGEAIAIDPLDICGDGPTLDVDLFGGAVFVGFPPVLLAIPNGLEDLYAANPSFNHVYTIGNTGSSEFTAWELAVIRALHGNWQLRFNYTLSRARGPIASVVNGDPSLSGAETGPLDFDQRHAVKIQAAAHVARGIVLAGILTWATGTPYSTFETAADLDDQNNTQARPVLPTGGLNDSRNDAAWRLDGRIEKSFTRGRVSAGAFLLVENILNEDDLVIESATPDAVTLTGHRDFGRRFEIGAIFGF